MPNTGTEKRQTSNEPVAPYLRQLKKCPMCHKPTKKGEPCSGKCLKDFQDGENARAARRMAQMGKDTPKGLNGARIEAQGPKNVFVGVVLMDSYLSPKELAWLEVPESDLEAQEISRLPLPRFEIAQRAMVNKKRSSRGQPTQPPTPEPGKEMSETARLLAQNWANSEPNYSNMLERHRRNQNESYQRRQRMWSD